MGRTALVLLLAMCLVATRPASGAFNLRGSKGDDKGGVCKAVWVNLITAFGEEIGPARLEYDGEDATAYELARAAISEFEELKGVSPSKLSVSDGNGKVLEPDQGVGGALQGKKKDSPLYVHMPPAVKLNLREEGMELSLAVEFATEDDYKTFLKYGDVIHIQKGPVREAKLDEELDEEAFEDKPLARLRTLYSAVQASQVPNTYLMWRERVNHMDQI